MDDLEEWALKNGEIFIKVGNKASGVNGLDTRVLIFKTGRTNNLFADEVDYATITREGLSILRLPKGTLDSRTFLSDIKLYSKNSGLTTKGSEYPCLVVAHSNTYNVKGVLNFPDTRYPLDEISLMNDKKFVNESIGKSIEAARARETSKAAHWKKALEAEQLKSVQAQEFGKLIGGLLQPPTGEAPPPAGPPPPTSPAT